jgi:hypothetical protein
MSEKLLLLVPGMSFVGAPFVIPASIASDVPCKRKSPVAMKSDAAEILEFTSAGVPFRLVVVKLP